MVRLYHALIMFPTVTMFTVFNPLCALEQPWEGLPLSNYWIGACCHAIAVFKFRHSLWYRATITVCRGFAVDVVLLDVVDSKAAECFGPLVHVVFTLNNLHQHQKLVGQNTSSPNWPITVLGVWSHMIGQCTEHVTTKQFPFLSQLLWASINVVSDKSTSSTYGLDL